MFMNNAILKMYENGQFHNIKKKWEVLKPQCTPLIRRGNPMSFSKLISLFAIIGIGIFIAFFVMAYECFAKPKKEVLKHDTNIEVEKLKSIIHEVHSFLKNDKQPPKHLLITLKNYSLNVTSGSIKFK